MHLGDRHARQKGGIIEGGADLADPAARAPHEFSLEDDGRLLKAPCLGAFPHPPVERKRASRGQDAAVDLSACQADIVRSGEIGTVEFGGETTQKHFLLCPADGGSGTRRKAERVRGLRGGAARRHGFCRKRKNKAEKKKKGGRHARERLDFSSLSENIFPRACPPQKPPRRFHRFPPLPFLKRKNARRAEMPRPARRRARRGCARRRRGESRCRPS